jgi:hypothetical protein
MRACGQSYDIPKTSASDSGSARSMSFEPCRAGFARRTPRRWVTLYKFFVRHSCGCVAEHEHREDARRNGAWQRALRWVACGYPAGRPCPRCERDAKLRLLRALSRERWPIRDWTDSLLVAQAAARLCDRFERSRMPYRIDRSDRSEAFYIYAGRFGEHKWRIAMHDPVYESSCEAIQVRPDLTSRRVRWAAC